MFLDAIIADLGLGRSTVSAAYTVGTLAASLSLPFIGRHIDRVGPRKAVVAIAILFALACAFMGLVAGFITLLIGFTLLRGFGQGALSLVSVHSINIWFVRRRGMAPVGGGLFRDRPELYGRLPERPHGADPGDDRAEIHYRLDEARRTITFWLYVTGGFLTAAFGTGLVFHHFSIVGQNGMGRPVAALMFVGYGVVAAIATLTTGFLMDRVAPRFLLALTLGLMGAAMLSASSVATTGAVIGYGVVLGGMQGMNQAIQSTVYGHYFGRLHFGSIKGMATTIMVAGTAAGPLLLAFGFDLSGSYQPVLWIAAALPLLLGAVTPFLPLMRDGRVL